MSLKQNDEYYEQLYEQSGIAEFYLPKKNRYIIRFNEPKVIEVGITAKDKKEALVYLHAYMRGLLDDSQKLSRGMTVRFSAPNSEVNGQYEIEEIAF